MWPVGHPEECHYLIHEAVHSHFSYEGKWGTPAYKGLVKLARRSSFVFIFTGNTGSTRVGVSSVVEKFVEAGKCCC